MAAVTFLVAAIPGTYGGKYVYGHDGDGYIDLYRYAS
jgi:hypothetical protein